MISLLVLAALILSSPASACCNCASSLSVNIGVAEGHQCAYVFSLLEPENGTCPTLQQAMCQWLAMQQSGGSAQEGLIAHYAFNDNLLDSTANHHDGSPEGEVTYDTGVCGQAGVFNGESKVEVDDFRNYQWGSQFSVSVWFNRTGSTSTYQGIVNTGYGSTGSWEIRMGRENSGQMLGGGVVTANSANVWDYYNLVATVGDWHHAVMTYDGSQLLFYLDNQLQSGSDDCCHGDIISKNTPLTIGQAGVGTAVEYFVGPIDEVKIFGKALSAEEVNSLFTSPCAAPNPVCPGM